MNGPWELYIVCNQLIENKSFLSLTVTWKPKKI